MKNEIQSPNSNVHAISTIILAIYYLASMYGGDPQLSKKIVQYSHNYINPNVLSGGHWRLSNLYPRYREGPKRSHQHRGDHFKVRKPPASPSS